MCTAACRCRAVLAGIAIRKMRQRSPVLPGSQASPVHLKNSDHSSSGNARYDQPVVVGSYPNGHAKPPPAPHQMGLWGLIQ